MSDTVEFQLKSWRRPIPYLTLLMIAAFVWFMGTGLSVLKLGLEREFALLAGSALTVAVVAWILWKDNRRMPAGALRLAPGKLEFTAGLQGPVVITPSSIRDMVDSEGALIVRQRKGPSVHIHPARLDVPLASVATAIASCMSETASEAGIDFINETARSQNRENRRRTIMAWCFAIAAICSILGKGLPLLLGK